MADPLGTWPKAPLVYVLAEVRTENLAELNEYQPVMAKLLRAEYPIQRKMNLARLVSAGNQLFFEQEHDQAWEFATPTNTTAVILRTNGVVLHATTYKDSEDFLKKLDTVIRIFAEIPSIYVSRLGLRYIDFILPKKNESPEDYVNGKLNPDLGLSKKPSGYGATNVASYPMDQGHLKIRYTRGSGLPKLPPDVGMLSLEQSPLMKSDNVSENQFTAILDTDRIIEFKPVEQLEATKIHGLFTIMRNDIRRAFFDHAITPHAKKIWSGQ